MKAKAFEAKTAAPVKSTAIKAMKAKAFEGHESLRILFIYIDK